MDDVYIDIVNRTYWNPWTGCRKKSEGCLNCYMFTKAAEEGKDGADVLRNDSEFSMPVMTGNDGRYQIESGSLLCVCMFSDFFIEEADKWRENAWEMIRMRKDLVFFLLTKRPERIKKLLPADWGDGWDNVICGCSCENQTRADERIPILLDAPFKHRQIMLSPLLAEVTIERYLNNHMIDMVVCDEENYEGKRLCDINWVKKVEQECRKENVNFVFEGATDPKIIFAGRSVRFNLWKGNKQFYREINLNKDQ